MRISALALPLGICAYLASTANGQVTVYHDRAAFTAAIGGSLQAGKDDYESYALEEIGFGEVRGDFRYTFDASITQPAVVPGGNGGQALGGAPSGLFVGGDTFRLSAGAGTALNAFGADLLYAPSFDTIPGDTYRVGIADGGAAGQFAGSLDSIDPSGGTFFLGLIADPGFEFTGIELSSVQPDPNFLVPAWQVDNLVYAGSRIVAATPEPGFASVLVCAVLAGAICSRRFRRLFERTSQ